MTLSKLAKSGVVTASLAALSIGGAYGVGTSSGPETDASEATSVVNKNGQTVDEHAAKGQERAAEARAQRTTRPEKPAEGNAEEDAPAEPTDRGNHGGPNEAAGDHPNENARTRPQKPETPKPQGPKDGPNEAAGDHPNENATGGPKAP